MAKCNCRLNCEREAMYYLWLTSEDFDTICFVGNRYGWSDILLRHCTEGKNEIPECIAWDIRDEMESDTKGGHGHFPMLDSSSELFEKLEEFLFSIV